MSERTKLTGEGRLEISRTLPATPERVWDYLTDPALRQKWFCGGEAGTKPGEPFVMAFDHSHLSKRNAPGSTDCSNVVTMEGTIITFDPPRLLSYSWPSGEHPDSTVTITLTPTDDGKTHLHLVHDGIIDPNHIPGAAAGWHAHLDLLLDLTEGKAARDFWDHHIPLEREYREEFGPAA